MHELWLCQSILEIIKENTAKKGHAQVKKVILEIGQLAAVEKNALIFSFNIASKGTVAENAVLEIIDVPAEAFCESCKKVVPLRQYYEECAACGSHSLEILQGEELRVQSMVVE
ncbi:MULTISPECIES: hydrogenase maturation nickel metallochaperone HypA [Legionella]|uniref:Hydrogenase maturation factor HypA n=1 Tax=Legionella resiliens TaxID=2905958 RepID=A0ABS8X315_9GAMM|nr:MULTISPECIES: hydrogenase maturation nickel metallochaperone HypA [unclassified Legionella]MCE0723219.1 hydrogenase maturation nickel metallochaperone HypA [Legionella sp. 9fVS26]MCE3532372.1 hydrogenase maturation nickel metallochaperone HypA [Legionella sp. 8cVS16]QLZ68512.1 Hydrogenase maturation factor HybF [Legionella sp. PC1000]